MQNIGEDDATDVTWSITTNGGLFKRINTSATGTATLLVVGESTPMDSGIFFGFGKINIVITAKAHNAFEVSVTKSAFLLGPFVVELLDLIPEEGKEMKRKCLAIGIILLFIGLMVVNDSLV